MDLGLKGRKAIVCASSRGLGRGCAMALARAGVDIVVNGRDEAHLARTAKEIEEATGVTVWPIAADVSTVDGQKALLARCPEPDILINNNGGPPRRNFRELDRDSIVAGLVQNMVTPIELIQSVVDGMAERGFGRIVNITSLSVVSPVLGLDLSSGARAGLTSFLAGVAREVAARNVTINNLLPGKMNTDRLTSGFALSAKKTGLSVQDEAARQAAAIPAQRFGEADEFGAICAFLCSTHAGYITGRGILVDGGLVPTAF